METNDENIKSGVSASQMGNLLNTGPGQPAISDERSDSVSKNVSQAASIDNSAEFITSGSIEQSQSDTTMPLESNLSSEENTKDIDVFADSLNANDINLIIMGKQSPETVVDELFAGDQCNSKTVSTDLTSSEIPSGEPIKIDVPMELTDTELAAVTEQGTLFPGTSQSIDIDPVIAVNVSNDSVIADTEAVLTESKLADTVTHDSSAKQIDLSVIETDISIAGAEREISTDIKETEQNMIGTMCKETEKNIQIEESKIVEMDSLQREFEIDNNSEIVVPKKVKLKRKPIKPENIVILSSSSSSSNSPDSKVVASVQSELKIAAKLKPQSNVSEIAIVSTNVPSTLVPTGEKRKLEIDESVEINQPKKVKLKRLQPQRIIYTNSTGQIQSIELEKPQVVKSSEKTFEKEIPVSKESDMKSDESRKLVPELKDDIEQDLDLELDASIEFTEKDAVDLSVDEVTAAIDAELDPAFDLKTPVQSIDDDFQIIEELESQQTSVVLESTPSSSNVIEEVEKSEADKETVDVASDTAVLSSEKPILESVLRIQENKCSNLDQSDVSKESLVQSSLKSLVAYGSSDSEGEDVQSVSVAASKSQFQTDGDASTDDQIVSTTETEQAIISLENKELNEEEKAEPAVLFEDKSAVTIPKPSVKTSKKFDQDDGSSSVVPKITIKPIPKPEEHMETNEKVVPKITIKPIPKPVDRRQESVSSISSVSSTSSSEEESMAENKTNIVPKITIKPIPKPEEISESLEDRSESSNVPRITIKSIAKPEGVSLEIVSKTPDVEKMSVPKITIKPISKPEEPTDKAVTLPSVPKITIKSIQEAETLTEKSAAPSGIPKLTVKSVQKSDILTDERSSSPSIPKITIKTCQKPEIISEEILSSGIPKLTIKTAQKHEEPAEKMLVSPSIPKLTIKTVQRPEETAEKISVSPTVPKLTIRTVQEPKDITEEAPEEPAEKMLASPSIPKLTIKTVQRPEETAEEISVSPTVPKLTIRTVQEPKDITEEAPEELTEKMLASPSIPKLTIKTVQKPEETAEEISVSPTVPKLTIRTVQEPKDITEEAAVPSGRKTITTISSESDKAEEISTSSTVPKITIKTVSKCEDTSEVSASSGVPKLTMKTIQKAEDTEKMSVTPSVPKITIKTVPNPESTVEEKLPSPSIPKITIKTVSNPESTVEEKLPSPSIPKITIKTVPNPESTVEEKLPSPSIPKITIKTVQKPEKEGPPTSPSGSKITMKSVQHLETDERSASPSIPKITIKTIQKVDSVTEERPASPSIPKITIKPVQKPDNLDRPSTSVNIPKITIKTVQKPEESNQKDCAQRNEDVSQDNTVSSSIPKITIKPVLKPEDTAQDPPGIAKLTLKNAPKLETSEVTTSSNVPKITIKPIQKPDSVSQDVATSSSNIPKPTVNLEASQKVSTVDIQKSATQQSDESTSEHGERKSTRTVASKLDDVNVKETKETSSEVQETATKKNDKAIISESQKSDAGDLSLKHATDSKVTTRLKTKLTPDCKAVVSNLLEEQIKNPEQISKIKDVSKKNVERDIFKRQIERGETSSKYVENVKEQNVTRGKASKVSQKHLQEQGSFSTPIGGMEIIPKFGVRPTSSDTVSKLTGHPVLETALSRNMPKEFSKKQIFKSSESLTIKPVLKQGDDQHHGPKITIKPIPVPICEGLSITPTSSLSKISVKGSDFLQNPTKSSSVRSSSKETPRLTLKPLQQLVEPALLDKSPKEHRFDSPIDFHKMSQHDESPLGKLEKITLKLSKQGGHPEIVPQQNLFKPGPVEIFPTHPNYAHQNIARQNLSQNLHGARPTGPARQQLVLAKQNVSHHSPNIFRHQKPATMQQNYLIGAQQSSTSKQQSFSGKQQQQASVSKLMAQQQSPGMTKQQSMNFIKQQQMEMKSGSSRHQLMMQTNPLKRALMPDTTLEPVRTESKRVKTETVTSDTSNVFNNPELSIRVVEPSRMCSKKQPTKLNDNVTIMMVGGAANATSRKSPQASSAKPETRTANVESKLKEILMKLSQKQVSALTTADSPMGSDTNSTSSDDVKIVGVVNKMEMVEAILDESTNSSQDVMIIDEFPAKVEQDPLEIKGPRKRGRPRKIPLEVREGLNEEETVEPIGEPIESIQTVKENETDESASSRPKRSCKGRSPIVPKPARRGRGGRGARGNRGGRGGGQKRGSMSPASSSKEIKKEGLSSPTPKETGTSKQSIPASIINMKSTIPLREVRVSLGEKIEQQLPEIAATLSVTTAKCKDSVFEEEDTRMSADGGGHVEQQTVKQAPDAAVADESRSSSTTTESGRNKRGRLEIADTDGQVTGPDQLAEYMWNNAGPYMLQEQVAQYLGVKSFKRKYPQVPRRPVDMQERDHLRENNLATEAQCDMGLTAVPSSDMLDIMYSDFHEKYEEYRKYQRERQAKDITNKQKQLNLATSDKGKMDSAFARAVRSAASWNANFNRTRRTERRCCMDLQTFTVFYPRSSKQPQVQKPKVGHYPVALLPWQYTDYYRDYTPSDLNYLPLNTVMYGPPAPNTRLAADVGQSDGSQGSDSDSSSSSGSDSDSSDDSDTTLDDVLPLGTPVSQPSPVQTVQTPQIVGQVMGPMPEACKMCSGNMNKNKLGKPEMLIQCGQCLMGVHPSCLDLTQEMLPRIQAYNWQCTDCKTCWQCREPSDDDKMLFCDRCDRGYHIYCVGLRKVPPGKWHCQQCSL